jgi:hypothetical protein
LASKVVTEEVDNHQPPDDEDADARLQRMVEEASERAAAQAEKDAAMTADELIEDFALGIMRVCDDNLRMNREVHGDDYPEADEVGFDVLHQSCDELFFTLSTKEDAMEAVERWVDHERWCVRALAQGAKHLLEHGSFLYGPHTGEEYDEDDERDDDFEEFCDFANFNVN